jgi:hypothetical protein
VQLRLTRAFYAFFWHMDGMILELSHLKVAQAFVCFLSCARNNASAKALAAPHAASFDRDRNDERISKSSLDDFIGTAICYTTVPTASLNGMTVLREAAST